MGGNPRLQSRVRVWVACPASVSAGVRQKKLGQEKKRGMKGEGEKRKRSSFLPPPTSFIFFFCSPFNFRAIVSLSKGVFEERTTGSEAISLLICLDATKFMLPSFFTLTEAICPKF